LTHPFIAIEGGALDDDNLEPGVKKQPYTDRKKLEDLLNSQGTIITKLIDKQYVTNNQKVTEAGKKFYLDSFDNNPAENKSVSFNEAVDLPRPSAILNATYDLGYIHGAVGNPNLEGTNESGTGLFLGISKIPRTNELKNKNQIVQEGTGIKINPRHRRVLAIFKTNNYCKEIENNGALATEAIQLMDTTPVNDLTNAFKGMELDKLGVYVFPGLLDLNFGMKQQIVDGKKVFDEKGNAVLVEE
jgi:hypothetical protein